VPPYKVPVKAKPKKAPASGAASAIAKAVKTGTKAAAKTTPPRPQVNRTKVRVKANPKPKPRPTTIKGAGDSKSKHTPKPTRAQKTTVTGSKLGQSIARAPKKATNPKTHPAFTGGYSHVAPVGKTDPSQSGFSKAVDSKFIPAQKKARATVEKVLEQTSRPNHAIAAGTRAAIHGDSIPKAAGKGFALKDKSTFSDVLGDVGVKNKAVKGVAGFGLDVVTDPTMYLTLGAGAPAKLSEKAATKATEKGEDVTTRGLNVGMRAKIPGTDKGFHVKSKSVNRATAFAGRKAKNTKLGKKAGETNAKVRNGLNETIAPDITPSYRTRAEQSVDNVMKRIPTRSEHKIVRGYDQAQGRVKSFQTVYAPGYHARNLVGDSLNAWLHDTTGKSFLQSRKVLKAQGAKNEFERSSEAVTVPGPKAAKAQKYLDQTVDVGKAGKMRVGDLIRLAEEHGAINTGQVAGELRDLTGDAEVRRRLLRGGKTKVSTREHRFSEYRENLPRLATFRQALADGMTPELAARHSLKAHIDYQDLTKFERVGLRRAFQFYTFFARNSRIQATRLVQRPGKFAAIQHVLDETAKAAGFQDYNQYADQLQDYEQKGIPLPVRYGGHVYPIFFNPPTTDLAQLSTNAKEQLLQNFASRLTTWKTLAELVSNRSIFFGLSPIKNGDQLTPAPSEVQYLPEPLKKKLGVTRILSHGKWVWGWDPRVDYAFRVLPQSNLALQTTKPTADDRGLNTNLSIGVSALTGVKIGPDRRKDAAKSKLYDERTKVEDRLKFLRTQKGLSADRPNTEYSRLSRRLKDLNAQLIPAKTSGPKTAQQEFEDFRKQSKSKSAQDEFNDFLKSR
jgi:hypothetical protein